jgi:hypothetical protein
VARRSLNQGVRLTANKRASAPQGV